MNKRPLNVSSSKKWVEIFCFSPLALLRWIVHPPLFVLFLDLQVFVVFAQRLKSQSSHPTNVVEIPRSSETDESARHPFGACRTCWRRKRNRRQFSASPSNSVDLVTYAVRSIVSPLKLSGQLKPLLMGSRGSRSLRKSVLISEAPKVLRIRRQLVRTNGKPVLSPTSQVSFVFVGIEACTYSKICFKWPPHGARKSGRYRQVVPRNRLIFPALLNKCKCCGTHAFDLRNDNSRPSGASGGLMRWFSRKLALWWLFWH